MTRGARRAGSAVLAVGLAIVLIVVMRDEERVDPYSTFVTAHLEVSRPEVDLPGARFSRTITKFTALKRVEAALDACTGPVAVDVPAGYPVLVAEHDYCGGQAWIPKLKTSDVVGLAGPGVLAGLYTAGEIKYVDRYDSTFRDLPDGDVVLQTCISRKTMVLVALTFAAPAAT